MQYTIGLVRPALAWFRPEQTLVDDFVYHLSRMAEVVMIGGTNFTAITNVESFYDPSYQTENRLNVLRQMAEEKKHHQFDMLFFMDLLSPEVPSIVMDNPEIPYAGIVTSTTRMWDKSNRNVVGRFEDNIMEGADRIYVATQALKDALMQHHMIGGDKVAVVGYPCRVDKAFTATTKEKILVMPQRVCDDNGLQVLIDAAREYNSLAGVTSDNASYRLSRGLDLVRFMAVVPGSMLNSRRNLPDTTKLPQNLMFRVVKNKHDYLSFLSRCQWVLGWNDRDTMQYEVMEAVLAGATPIVRPTPFTDELFPTALKVNSASDLARLLFLNKAQVNPSVTRPRVFDEAEIKMIADLMQVLAVNKEPIVKEAVIAVTPIPPTPPPVVPTAAAEAVLPPPASPPSGRDPETY